LSLRQVQYFGVRVTEEYEGEFDKWNSWDIIKFAYITAQKILRNRYKILKQEFLPTKKDDTPKTG